MELSGKKKGKAGAEKQNILKRAWNGWKKIARKIGDFNARVILTIFYFILLLPFALLIKIFTDPLEIKNKTPKGWHKRVEKDDIPTLERAERQF